MRTPRHLDPVRVLAAALLLASGLGFSGARPAAAAAATTAATGPAVRVHAFGLPTFADLAAAAKPVVGISATPSGGGYWLVASDGGIFTSGDAPFAGSTGGLRLNKPIVAVAPTPTGLGYWLVASDGGIFTYGDARFFGSAGGAPLNKPIVGMAPTPGGLGYWLVASDGGIFTFGDAPFAGSTGGLALNRPVVGMAATASGRGYWMVGGDGGIFTFGDAGALGSVPGTGTTVGDVVGMTRSTGGAGYLVTARNGRVWSFGDSPFHGSATLVANRTVVGIAAAGGGYWVADAEIPVRPSVGPPLPANAGSGRRVVYCVSCQRVWHVEADGARVRSFLVSGRVATPRAGTYSVYSKSRYARSTSPGVTMEYMVRFAYGRTLAIGFHSIPRKYGVPIQSESQLGTFRSSGCVRQADRDALATWNFAPIGTKVVVTP